MSYRIMGRQAGPELSFGQTVDISSAGVLFTAETPLRPGDPVELSINWPARLDGRCALQLIVKGNVSRCNQNEAAVEICSYEFRTRGPHFARPLAGAVSGVQPEDRAACA